MTCGVITVTCGVITVTCALFVHLGAQTPAVVPIRSSVNCCEGAWVCPGGTAVSKTPTQHARTHASSVPLSGCSAGSGGAGTRCGSQPAVDCVAQQGIEEDGRVFKSAQGSKETEA